MAAIPHWINATKALLTQSFCRHRALEITPQCGNKVAIVTGGNKGIGLETAKALCRAGIFVIIGCRFDESTKEAIRKIHDEIPEAKVEYMQLDLASLKSVHIFVEKFRKKNIGLHLLVNNAGVMFMPYTLTEDGYESHFGINHIGHFLLTNLLLEILKRSGTKDSYSRIIIVSSEAHRPGTINFDDLQFKNGYSPYDGYAQSKLANVMFAYELQRQLCDERCYVTANAVHPGVVNTDLYRHLPWYFSYPMELAALLLFKSAKHGASTSIYAALSSEAEKVGGKYFDNCQAVETNTESYDKEKQQKLWEVSCRLAGL